MLLVSRESRTSFCRALSDNPVCLICSHSRILKQVHKIRLRGLLQRQDGRALPPQARVAVVDHVRHHVQRDFPNLVRDRASKLSESIREEKTKQRDAHHSCKRQLAKQQVRRLLIFPNLPQRDGPGPVARLLACRPALFGRACPARTRARVGGGRRAASRALPRRRLLRRGRRGP